MSVRLTAAELESLEAEIERAGEIWGLTDGLASVIENIITARLAAVEALADEWERSEQRTWISSCGDDLRAALA